MKILRMEQGSDEWHQARCGIPTASCFADILATIKSGEAAGRRNYRTRLVVERLTGKPIGNTFDSFALRQGHEREPMARDAYSIKTGDYIDQVGFILHDEGFAGASPDGLIDDDGGLEVKCPELSAHLAYLRRTDEPPEYRAQIQGNLWITGRKWWRFVSWNPDFPENLQLVVRHVKRDEAYITALELAVRLFMDEVRAEEAELRKLAA